MLYIMHVRLIWIVCFRVRYVLFSSIREHFRTFLMSFSDPQGPKGLKKHAQTKKHKITPNPLSPAHLLHCPLHPLRPSHPKQLSLGILLPHAHSATRWRHKTRNLALVKSVAGSLHTHRYLQFSRMPFFLFSFLRANSAR